MESDDKIELTSTNTDESVPATRREWLKATAGGAIGTVIGMSGYLSQQDTAAATRSAETQPPDTARSSVRLGVETLLRERSGFLDGERLGLITNPSGTDSKLRSTIDLLYEHESFDLRKLFSPEHGIRGNAEAGEEVGIRSTRKPDFRSSVSTGTTGSYGPR